MTKTSPPHNLLEDLRVVELSSDLAAPLVGMLLAEQGAEVIRIVDPSCPSADPVRDALLSRGKTEITLDHEQPDDVALLHRLLARADVALQDGEGRWPLDLQRLREEHNPALISCSIPAFPLDDPRAKLPGYEALAGAAGFLYNRPIGTPRYHDFPVGSVIAALYAANAVVAALIARLRLGRGQHVEASLYHSALVSQVVQILIKAGVPRGFLALKMIGSPFMRCWRCKDERYVYLHITLPAHNAQMLRVLEQSGHAAEVKRLRAIMSPETMRDPSQVKNIKEAKRIKAIYTEVFLMRTADEWEEILGRDLCCIKVRTSEEWLRDSLAAGMTDACEVEDPIFGQLLGPGPLVTAPEHPPVVRPRRREEGPPQVLLRRWEEAPRAGLPDQGTQEAAEPALRHALEGVKVLDLSRVIAGPCAARVLAEFGADVLAVQSETSLDWALSFHLIFNAGKRSVTLDFTTDEGKQRLWQLIDWYRPDAFIHNYRHLDLARAIGVGPEEVLGRFPGIVYTHLNAYGNHGVWKDRPGFEQVVQAVSGIQMAYAGEGRPKLLPSPVIDIGCGLLGALGTLMGLYHERRTHKGVVVTTHLTSVSVLLQLPSISDFQRGACLARAEQRGHDLRRDEDQEVVADIFWTLGSFACLCGPRRDLRRWLERSGLAEESGVTLHALLKRVGLANSARTCPELELAGRHLFKRPVAHWQRSLVEAGVQDTVWIMPYPSIRHAVEEIRGYDPRPHPVVRRRAFPGSPQELTFIASPARMSLTPLAEVPPPPQRGADTEEVLRQAGLEVAPGSGVIPYPADKPLLIWLASFARWGYFAWKSGNI
jgi:crotonobetainyl-CoA:carnitine CoA-transferase CaiB-like acyl-CoA transferase